MLKKIFVTAVAAAAIALTAAPAFAGTASLSGVSNGSIVSGAVTVSGFGTAATAENLRKIEILRDGSVMKSQDFDGIQESGSTSWTWNTRDGKNGEFTITVRASFSGGGSDTSSVNVKVANEPVSPSGVSANWNGSQVVISWNANPEPDITGYLVERNGSSLGRVEGTSMTDSPGSGDHTYRVTALRYSPAGEKASSPSGGATVNVPASAPPSDGGGDDSSSGGGYYQGDGDNAGGYYQGGGNGDNAGGYYQGGNGNGGSVDGYGSNGNKGGKSGGKDRSNGRFNYGSYGSGFIGGLNLPGRLLLPGNFGLSPNAQDSIDWGDYEETLPYDLNGTGSALPEEFLGGRGYAARTENTLIPADGLRWVAAGLWFMIAAALLKFLEKRLAESEAAEAAGVAENKGVKGMAKAARKLSLRELLADDPIEHDADTPAVIEETKDGGAVSFKTSKKDSTDERHLKVVKDTDAA